MVTAKKSSTCVDVLQTINSYPDLQDIGDNVRQIRKCTIGSLLLVLNRKAQEKTKQILIATAEKMSDKVEVTCTGDSVAFELNELDELTVAEEMHKAHRNQIEGAKNIDISVVQLLRKAYGDIHIAVVVLSTELARKSYRKWEYSSWLAK
ncbi:unnamed protein product [Nezara viridula]|uniref:Uncharacterized protein n=1 Tax=Nezara viridula TaxID=85310 RepID=A0A9P0H5H8_NEZVI|nr:unnamed protein product [Nezara viridula]